MNKNTSQQDELTLFNFWLDVPTGTYTTPGERKQNLILIKYFFFSPVKCLNFFFLISWFLIFSMGKQTFPCI